MANYMDKDVLLAKLAKLKEAAKPEALEKQQRLNADHEQANKDNQVFDAILEAEKEDQAREQEKVRKAKEAIVAAHKEALSEEKTRERVSYLEKILPSYQKEADGMEEAAAEAKKIAKGLSGNNSEEAQALMVEAEEIENAAWSKSHKLEQLKDEIEYRKKQITFLNGKGENPDDYWHYSSAFDYSEED